ncbi:hypothetical protein QKU48_gp0120 [Fadolivirus algeromassiliense]|jgi:hypothetical protein|uniref:Uncharacterized protein n=1 Tax=Fadolivirus FV1/VV64 TaxID=3070911 RepID=A0A7D3R170_9VIRU|nr:hypothetical protein QKU48_gp0120 [Fadolivirus algeromassiliense]QKF93578.1 hypothetical protein Fadolivirus_1_120 [Fadolivirus FV1/VV64]
MATNELILNEIKELRSEVRLLKTELSTMREDISKLIGQQLNRSRSNSLDRPISEERFVSVLPHHLQRRNTDTSIMYRQSSPRPSSPRVKSPRMTSPRLSSSKIIPHNSPNIHHSKRLSSLANISDSNELINKENSDNVVHSIIPPLSLPVSEL